MSHILLIDSSKPSFVSTNEISYDWLSASCRQRLDSIKHAGRRSHFILGRYLLCVALIKYGRFEDYHQISISEVGKPFLDGFAFSISHSKHLVAIAFSTKELQIGLDIEWMDKRSLDPFTHFFHEDEVQYISENSGSDVAFYNHWTAKEAALKYKGLGIDHVLNFKVDVHESLVKDIENQTIIPYNFRELKDHLGHPYALSCTCQIDQTIQMEQVQFDLRQLSL